MRYQPLADRIRPQLLDEFIGQTHLLGPGAPIRDMLQNKRIYSMIFWGPPGVGKTTLAHLLAREMDLQFTALSAVSANKDDLRRLIQQNETQLTPMERMLQHQAAQEQQTNVLLFLDEIHRFNKAQQDFLLPHVETGTITLIGATTENPSFEVISALLSRVRVFILEPLSTEELARIVQRGAQELHVDVAEDAMEILVKYANGDGRVALNTLESVVQFRGDASATITADHLRALSQSRHLRYDRTGDEHYNTISAFIKSMRAGDIDATLYYLARMVVAGEDPEFIARRMIIFASEDIGLADLHALTVANAVFRAVEAVGYPEAQINLAHGAVYLAAAPKSREAYDGYFAALEDVQQHGNLPIPLPLRNAPTQLMHELGYGQNAKHDSLLPDSIKGTRYFRKHEK